MKKTNDKLSSMLKHFSRGEKIHRFQAEKLGDHCLHSTISDIQKKHGIYFNRQTIKIPNNFNASSHVSQYWLEGRNLTRAKNIVRKKVTQ